MEWEFDERASGAFYSRAVVGDLCPDPVTPLTATVGVAAELGAAWRDVYAEAGLLAAADAPPRPERRPVVMFGAHLYLNTSLLRRFGVHATGADPTVFARQYLGERADVPRQRDEPATPPVPAARPREWADRALLPAPDLRCYEVARRGAAELVGSRPELAGLTDDQLIDRLERVRPALREALRLHARAELALAVAAELLTRTAGDAGFPGATGALVAGNGGAEPEPPLGRLWELAALVRGSGRLGRLFDQGTDDVSGELDTARTGDLAELRRGRDRLCADLGHLGPSEWELGADSWGTDTRLTLHLVDTLRRVAGRPTPPDRAGTCAARSAESAARVRRALRATPAATARFDRTLAATARWLQVRRGARAVVSSVHHEQRLAARELGVRRVRSGVLDEVDQVFMLLHAELRAFAADSAEFGEPLRMRAYDYFALATYQPPFVTVGQPPPVVRWPRGATGAPAFGRRLSGTPVAPGRAVGPARLPGPPEAGSGVRPGDVLVLPAGGPAWVPLLAAAAAVVVDGGSALSDVAVACRDLDIPCVAATVDATARIHQGTAVEVDGTTGSVRLAPRPVAEHRAAGRAGATPRVGSRVAAAPGTDGARDDGRHGTPVPEEAAPRPEGAAPGPEERRG
ncbi:MAG TPA: PEP-utilizing enzyme [Pseudonocardia sp.]|jgi:pyruvate,water dikinase